MNDKLIAYAHLFNQNTFANMSSILLDGSPHTTPVWYHYEEALDLIKITLFENSQKDKNFQRNPNVSLSITDPENPYCYVQIRGSIIERTADKNNYYADFLTNKYSNGARKEYGDTGNNKMILITIKPEKISGWAPESAKNFMNWMKGK